MSMLWIDTIILGLIDTYDTNDPYELCDSLDILIFKVKPDNPLLLKENSLLIRNYLNSDKDVIFIRDNLPESYESFYLKHELGHAILHPDIINSFNRNLVNVGKMEKEANYFALKLCHIKLDSIQFEQFTLEQIASYLELPYEPLKQIINL